MSDDTTDTTPGLGAPIMPTGSGVADLEIAREQDAMAAMTGDAETAPPTDGDEVAEEFAGRDDLAPTIVDGAADASEAHPS